MNKTWSLMFGVTFLSIGIQRLVELFTANDTSFLTPITACAAFLVAGVFIGISYGERLAGTTYRQ